MSATDLFAADFPHGTANGFDHGCRSKAVCQVDASLWLTCLEVHTGRMSDYNLRNVRPDEPVERPSHDHSAAPKPKPKNRPALPVEPIGAEPEESLATTVPSEVVKVSDGRTADPSITTPVLRVPGSRGPAPAAHGTNGRWKLGCTDPAECPNVTSGGLSCSAAHEVWLAAKPAKHSFEGAKARKSADVDRAEAGSVTEPTSIEQEPAAEVHTYEEQQDRIWQLTQDRARLTETNEKQFARIADLEAQLATASTEREEFRVALLNSSEMVTEERAKIRELETSARSAEIELEVRATRISELMTAAETNRDELAEAKMFRDQHLHDYQALYRKQEESKELAVVVPAVPEDPFVAIAKLIAQSAPNSLTPIELGLNVLADGSRTLDLRWGA